MRNIVARFSAEHKYEIDENDPAFGQVDDNQLKHLIRMMVFIDLFQSTREEDVLPLIEVTIGD